MPPKPILLGATGISAVFGICLLVTASLTINFFEPAHSFCKLVGADCAIINYWMAAGSFGIIASLLHLGSIGAAWLNKTKIWCGLHIIIFLLTLTAFAIGVDKNAFTKPTESKIVAFTVFCILDCIFSLAAAVGVHFLDQRG